MSVKEPSKRSYTTILFGTAIFLVMIMNLISCSFSSEKKVLVGKKSLCVPKEFIVLQGSKKEGNSSASYDVSSLSLVVAWRLNFVASHIPSFKITHSDHQKYNSRVLRASIYVPSNSKLLHFGAGSTYADRLRLTGSFKDAIVSKDNESGFYKISRRVEYPNKWEVLKIMPGENVDIPKRKEDYWIASCSDYGDRYGGLDCRTEFDYDDLYIFTSITGPNLHLREKIKEFVTNQIDMWEKRKC